MSTAPWNQARNASTLTRTQAELDALINERGYEIHTQREAYTPAGEPQRYCCLVSWPNPAGAS